MFQPIPASDIESGQRQQARAEILAPASVPRSEDLSELDDYLVMAEAQFVDSVMTAARLHRDEAASLIKMSWLEDNEAKAEAAAAQSELHIREYYGHVVRLKLLGIDPDDIPSKSLKY